MHCCENLWMTLFRLKFCMIIRFTTWWPVYHQLCIACFCLQNISFDDQFHVSLLFLYYPPFYQTFKYFCIVRKLIFTFVCPDTSQQSSFNCFTNESALCWIQLKLVRSPNKCVFSILCTDCIWKIDRDRLAHRLGTLFCRHVLCHSYDHLMILNSKFT